jgi:hypothetical protein
VRLAEAFFEIVGKNESVSERGIPVLLTAFEIVGVIDPVET